MSLPRISILTPVYNGAQYLPELIESVRNQSYRNHEHVLIDDGSTDGGATADVLSRYPHLRWYTRPNEGQYATQNELLQISEGDVVVVICADDMLASSKALETVARKFAESPDCQVVYGMTSLLAMRGNGRYIYKPYLHAPFAHWMLPHALCVQHCALFVRRDLIHRENLWFNPTYRIRGDWDWIIRVFLHTRHVRYTNEVVACWRLHEAQTSAMQTALGEAESRRLCRSHDFSYSTHQILQRAVSIYGLARSAWSRAQAEGVRPTAYAICKTVWNITRRSH